MTYGHTLGTGQADDLAAWFAAHLPMDLRCKLMAERPLLYGALFPGCDYDAILGRVAAALGRQGHDRMVMTGQPAAAHLLRLVQGTGHPWEGSDTVDAIEQFLGLFGITVPKDDEEAAGADAVAGAQAELIRAAAAEGAEAGRVRAEAVSDSEANGIEADTGRPLNAVGRDLTQAAYAARDRSMVTRVSIGGRQAAAVVPLDTAGHPRRRPADDGAECVITLASGRTIRTDSYQASPPGSSYARVCDPDGTEVGYWDSAEWQEAPRLVMAAILGAARGGARGGASPLYSPGQAIEYTSFDPSGYTPGQVVSYADAAEQDTPGSLLVYIRARSGGRPFRVRESQLRARVPGPRFTAHFTPEAWQNDQAITVDPQGPQEWDCTEFAILHPGDVQDLADRGDLAEGVVDNDDLFRGDMTAPPWVRQWAGPFTITIRRED